MLQQDVQLCWVVLGLKPLFQKAACKRREELSVGSMYVPKDASPMTRRMTIAKYEEPWASNPTWIPIGEGEVCSVFMFCF